MTSPRLRHYSCSLTMLAGSACAAEDAADSGGDAGGSDTTSSSGVDDPGAPRTDDGDGGSGTGQGSPTSDSTGDPGATGEPGTSTGAAHGSTDAGGSTDATGGMGGTVSGSVTRSVMPAPGGDAIGELYVALADECSFNPTFIAATSLPADLSGPAAAQPYAIEDVPAGDMFFMAFLDDDGDATPVMPSPGSGDFVVSDGVGGIGCVAVSVAGEDVDGVDIDLNFVLP